MLNTIDIVRIIIPLGVLVFIYLAWRNYVYIAKRTAELGVKHKLSSISFFDGILISTVIGIIVGRITHIIPQLDYLDIRNWSLLPYDRFGNVIEWFGNYPWRLVSFLDGVTWWIVWPIVSTIILGNSFISLQKAIKALKVEKKGMLRQLTFKYYTSILLIISLGGILTFLSLVSFK